MTNSLSITGGNPQSDTKYARFLEKVVSAFHAKYPNQDIRPSNKINTDIHAVHRRMGTKITSTHFEWVVWSYPPAEIEVGLHFEDDDRNVNLQKLNNLMQYQQSAQKQIDPTIVFAQNFKTVPKGTRIHVKRKYISCTDLPSIDWAVSTMNSFMSFFLPLL